MKVITPTWKKIIADLLKGMSYTAAEKEHDLPRRRIQGMFHAFLQDRAPEVYSVISADGKITPKEIADHRNYLENQLAIEGAGELLGV